MLIKGIEKVNFRLAGFLINRLIDIGWDRNEVADCIDRMATEPGVEHSEAEVFRELAEAYRGNRRPRFEVIEGGKNDNDKSEK
jgi:hypothetical protein